MLLCRAGPHSSCRANMSPITWLSSKARGQGLPGPCRSGMCVCFPLPTSYSLSQPPVFFVDCVYVLHVLGVCLSHTRMWVPWAWGPCHSCIPRVWQVPGILLGLSWNLLSNEWMNLSVPSLHSPVCIITYTFVLCKILYKILSLVSFFQTSTVLFHFNRRGYDYKTHFFF